MTEIFIEEDTRGRVSLNKFKRSGRYLGSQHQDGTITLTPAEVMTKAQAQYLRDDEMQRIVDTGLRNAFRAEEVEL